MKKSCLLFALLVTACLHFSCNGPGNRDKNLQITIALPDSSSYSEVSGRLILMFDNDTSGSLIFGISPDKPIPVYTKTIDNLSQGSIIKINSFDRWWYKKPGELNGYYAVRAIFDRDTTERAIFLTGGNLYSEKQIIKIEDGEPVSINLTLQNEYPGWQFTETEFTRELILPSPLLTTFNGFITEIRSAVILPPSYFSDSLKYYPVVYIFPGFGSHHAAVTYGTGQADRYGINTVGSEKIFIFCNIEFSKGVHHFADSENNGPWGKAFTEELVPYIEENFRVIPEAHKRFLAGQSSGAWTAAFLQVSYPEMFNGAFIASPDPLDFRAMAFNIYERGANFYRPVNEKGKGINNSDNKRLYALLEDVLDEYGQIRSWESTFSPRTKKGEPAPLFNRHTGRIDPAVATAWKKYDISGILSSDPARYSELLQNKLHFFVSMDDNWGLQKSVLMLEKKMNELGIRASFTYLENMGHVVWSDSVREYVHGVIDSISATPAPENIYIIREE